MKLAKLSLAAILAAGALSSISAAPLEEAIKDIDVSGFGRYRFDSEKLKEDSDKEHKSFHHFTLDVNFKATLDDNFFSVIGLRYDALDVTGSHKNEGSGLTNAGIIPAPNSGIASMIGKTENTKKTTSFSVRYYYVGFTGISDTTVLFGRQSADTFFTTDIAATGLKVVNTSIPGVTLVGAFFTNFEEDGDLAYLPTGVRKWGPDNDDDTDDEIENTFIHQRNLWGLAAIGSFDWFSFQAWYAGLHKTAHLFALELAGNYPVSDDVRLRAKAQVAGTKLTKSFRKAYQPPNNESGVKSSLFTGVQLGLSAYGLDADLGFASYGKKNKVSLHTLEDKGYLIEAGEELIRYVGFEGKHTMFFAKLLYTYDAYSAGIDYVYDKAKNDSYKVKGQEIVARLGYKYNNKLDFKVWYSFVNEKTTEKDERFEDEKTRKNKLRFEAIYNF